MFWLHNIIAASSRDFQTGTNLAVAFLVLRLWSLEDVGFVRSETGVFFTGFLSGDER